MAPTPSEHSVALRSALTALYDGWLAGLRTLPDGTALLAVGALGRAEPAPYSDLDLVLVHTGRPGVRGAADAIWYPIWDAGVGLDHSVRTLADVRAIAERDARAALGLLDARFIAGDAALATRARASAYEVWRAKAHTHLPELHELARARLRSSGELAFLLEPNLKESTGGLRDVVVLRALAAAQLVDAPPAAVQAATTVLLDVRGELHRRVGRATDRLVAQEQGPVAVSLGYADADELLRTVSSAGRTITYAATLAWRAVAAELARRRRWRSSRGDGRRPLAEDVVEADGEVQLARAADPDDDPVLVLRVAAAAAHADLPIHPHTLVRLAGSPPLPEPWPTAAREAFVRLLDAGPPAVAVVEALDQHGLMSRLLPEWEHTRFRPQHNPVHRFTVDRHLIETAAEAAALTRDVARPDLLLLGCLLHDIGKGHPGDHSVVGAELVTAIGPRLGLDPPDAAVLTALVRHHLLLPDTATRRDIDDPRTIAMVRGAVGGSAEVLRLLHALTVADARATGPGAWSRWKGGLVQGLVNRVDAALDGLPPPPAPRLTDGRLLAARLDRIVVSLDGDELVVVAPDMPGLLSRTAGLLAVHSLDVRSATITTEGTRAVNVFAVEHRFGQTVDVDVLRSDLDAVLEHRFPLHERLAATERRYPAAPGREPARVLWFDDEATAATIVEVRAADRIGLLHRVTAALEHCDVDIRTARISTLGASVVDAFYVLDEAGAPVTDGALRSQVERSLLTAAAGGADDG